MTLSEGCDGSPSFGDGLIPPRAPRLADTAVSHILPRADLWTWPWTPRLPRDALLLDSLRLAEPAVGVESEAPRPPPRPHVGLQRERGQVPRSHCLCSLGCLSSGTFARITCKYAWRGRQGELKRIALTYMGFPGGSVVRNPPAKAGDVGSIPVSGRFVGGGNGSPPARICRGNPTGWQRVGHG